MQVQPIILVIAAAAICSGCVTAQERNAAIANSDDLACQSYGAAPGTDAYLKCRMTKDQQRQQNNAALMGVILSRPAPTPYVLPMPQNR